MMPERHLLVTTTRAAWVLDLETGLARLIDEGRGVYYGISFSTDQLFIACRQAAVGSDRDSQANVVLCFDHDLQPIGVLHPPIPVRDVHQILYAAGTLFICSTYDDAVLSYDPVSGHWQAWHPFGPGPGQDRHHINSVAVDGDDILLAGNRPHGWFARFGPDRRLVTHQPLGAGTHNVWVEDGEIYVCSSDEGAVRAAGGASRPIVARGWLRGIAKGHRTRYFGVSQNLVRGVRDRSDCMILEVDPDGSILRRFAFHDFGMLHDLRVLGTPDDTHNRLALHVSDDALAALTATCQTSPDPIDLLPRQSTDRPG